MDVLLTPVFVLGIQLVVILMYLSEHCNDSSIGGGRTPVEEPVYAAPAVTPAPLLDAGPAV